MDSAWDSGQFGGGVVEHVWMSDGLMMLFCCLECGVNWFWA